MALDSCHHRKKTLLYSDLFKCQTNIVPEKEEEISKVESWNSSSNQSSPCGSFSSGSTTTFCSSSESDDGDFTAELTRQMAEYMLQEEEEQDNTVIVEKASSRVKNNSRIYSRPVVSIDDPTPPVQLKNQNQPPVRKQGRPGYVGRRVNGSESAQRKTEGLHYNMMTQYREKREMGMGHPAGINGSGMQAIFLGGSGNGSPAGTGVFLPRLNSDPTELKNKKTGNCSIVLMPTRVLQALELHFKQRQHSTTVPPLSGGSLIHSGPKDESTISNVDSQLENRTPNFDEMQLPQEWTY